MAGIGASRLVPLGMLAIGTGAALLAAGLAAGSAKGATDGAADGTRTVVVLVALLLAVTGDQALRGRRSAAGSVPVLLEQSALVGPALVALRMLALGLVAGSVATGVQVALGGVALVGAEAVVTFASRQQAKTYAGPVRSRNVTLPGWAREAPADGTLRRGTAVMAEVLLVLGTLVVPVEAFRVDRLTVVVLLVAAGVVGPVATVLRGFRSPASTDGADGPVPRLRPVQAWLDTYRPEVVLHLAGRASAAYQVDVWLPALEALDRRVLVLIRDEELFEAMAPTSLPVLSIYGGTEVMSLDLSSVTVALFPTHVGQNLHLFRLPTLMTAFIGHGDSDKTASINPFARAYDEIWVSGEAAADRWRRAAVGIDDDRLRIVGRPQVDGVRVVAAHPDVPAGTPDVPAGTPTLLYAPTWEGWSATHSPSSVAVFGVALVEAALADPAGVAVHYRPHPLLGIRDAGVRRAHRRIVALLTERLTSDPAAGHAVVDPERSDLVTSVNAAGALAADVSSVVTDFLASGKPYGVVDPLGRTDDEFRAAVPTASAATVLGAGGRGVAELLDVLTGRRPDDRWSERADLAGRLLGPPATRGRAGFVAAVDALDARCRTERAAHRAAHTVPDD